MLLSGGEPSRRLVMTTPATAPESSDSKQRAFVRWKRQRDRARALRAESAKQPPQTLKQPAMRRRTPAPLFFARRERLFGDGDDGDDDAATGADPEEDELMRMIAAKERAEEAAEARDLFYSPVRPDVEHEGGGDARFRMRRVVGGRQQQQQQQQQPQNETRESNQRDDLEAQYRREVDDAWDEFVSGTSSTSAASLYRTPSPPPPPKNIFREEISTSRDAASTEAAPRDDDAGGRSRSQSQPPSANYSSESIPNVSYTPPMSPTAAAGSSRWPPPGSRVAASGGAGDENPGDSSRPRPTDAHRQLHRQLQQSPAAFPFWSVLFLVSCIVLGISGFFVEDAMGWAGKYAARASVGALSKDEQAQMHARLEQLQAEVHGFRYTASEIETHSLRAFEEVKAHLARMKSEREKHQEAIAREMSDLRASMLLMMSDMVEQERELIHARLQQLAAASADASADRSSRKPTDAANTSRAKAPVRDPETRAASACPAPEPAAEQPAVPKAADATTAPAPPRTGLSRGESVMLLSWELLMLLAAMSVLGGFVGLRVRNLNRRKRWFDRRRDLQAQLARERAERLGEFDDEEDEEDEEVADESDATESVNDDIEEAEDEDGEWDDSATESGVETVALLRRTAGDTPTSQGREGRRVRLRAHSSDAEEDEEDEADDDDQSVDSPPRQKAQRYAFVRDDPLEQSPSSRRRSPRLQRLLRR